MTTVEKWKESTRLWLINHEFADTVKACKESMQHFDDRGLFVNMYEQLFLAIEEFEGLNVEHPFIKVAFTDAYNQRKEELRKIQASLIERELIPSSVKVER